jgi:hypothetical protein
MVKWFYQFSNGCLHRKTVRCRIQKINVEKLYRYGESGQMLVGLWKFGLPICTVPLVDASINKEVEICRDKQCCWFFFLNWVCDVYTEQINNLSWQKHCWDVKCVERDRCIWLSPCVSRKPIWFCTRIDTKFSKHIWQLIKIYSTFLPDVHYFWVGIACADDVSSSWLKHHTSVALPTS